MTFIELADDNTRDLAMELFYSGDAPDLDAAAALAADMHQVLADCAEAWDFDAAFQGNQEVFADAPMLMPEGDRLDTNGMRV